MFTPTVRLRFWLLGALALALSALTGTIWLAGSGAAPAAGATVTAQSGDAIDPGDWHQENVALAADAAGNLYAAWADYRNAGVPHIRFAYRPAGGAWTASIPVDATGAGSQILPSMAVDGAGAIYLAWQDFRDGAALSQIRFAYRPAGAAWGVSQVVSPTTQSQIQPALAVNTGGAAVVAWVQRAGQQKPLDIYVATRPPGGVWSAGAPPLPAVTGSRTDPHAGLDDAGRAYLVWTEAGWDWPEIRFAMRPAGAAWSAAEKVNDAATNDWWAVARLAAPRDGSGPVHVIWMDNRSGNHDIYHATRPLAGAWSANVKVNDDSSAADQWTPSLALDAAGNAIAAWVDQRNGRWDLYRAARLAGGVWDANTLLVAGPAAGASARVVPQVTGCTSNPVTTGGDTGYSQGNTSDQCAQHNVHVTAAALARIEVAPTIVNLRVGEKQRFTATGYDAQGNQAPIAPEWAGTGGSISVAAAGQAGAAGSQAIYTAGTLPGRYEVSATAGSITGRAWVEITGATPPDLAPGGSWEHTFTTPGVYPYFDPFSPGHTGVVVVGAQTLRVSGNPKGLTRDTVRWTNRGAGVHAVAGGEPRGIYLPLMLK